MTIVPIALATGSSPARHGPEGKTRLINGYWETTEQGKHVGAIYPHAGLKDFATLTGGGVVRGMEPTDNGVALIAGRLAYLVDSSGTAVALGGVPSDGHVYMATNRKLPGGQIGVSANGLNYLIEGGSLTPIADTDLPPSTSVCHVDGFMIWSTFDGRLVSSSIDEAAAYDALDFVEAEGDRDPLVRVIDRRRELWAFGTETVEILTPNGAPDGFPFSRLTFVEYGTIAPASVAKVAGTLAWVTHEGIPALASGYDYQAIGDSSVARAISSLSDPTDIRGFGYVQDGHQFYVLTCPSWTWQCDLNNGLRWSERESFGQDNWKIRDVVKVGTKHIAGGDDGKLYELSPDYKDEAGQPLIMTSQGPVIHKWPGRVKFDRVFLDAVTGVGLNTTDTHNKDPQVMMKHSDDGGRTWSNERWRSLGKIGEYDATVDWTRCGIANRHGRIVQFAASADVVKCFNAAAADATAVRP